MRQSTLTKEVLQKYAKEVFIETGTGIGGGCRVAFDVGFQKVYSIELNPERIPVIQARFSREIDQGRFEIICGDSYVELAKLLSRIDCNSTFWLDAHWDGGICGKYKCPLFFELEAIANHPIKTHSVLIDDRRCFGREAWGIGINEKDVLLALHKINPAYTISYEPGYIANDIIAAKI